jgi:hypothetical protein
MQTFLPYANYQQSVHILDMKRLGKQRVETFQIMKVLKKLSEPATEKEKVGYEASLLDYQEETIAEWVDRGYLDTCWVKTLEVFESMNVRYDRQPPPWFGNDDLHESHQSSLVRKAPDYYRPIFPDVPDDIEYVWPVTKDERLIYE